MDVKNEYALTNYHTHTWRCQHSKGSEEEFVLRAIQNGFSLFGFADHSPWPYQSDYVSFMRMRLDQFEDYKQTVRSLGEKYDNQIQVKLGLECEAFPQYMSWLADFKKEHLDYVILGNHYDYTDEGNLDNSKPLSDTGGFYFGRCERPDEIRRYGKRTVAGMQTGIFDYVAHPDLFCFNYPKFDADCAAVSRDICAAAEAYRIPLEFNLMGVQHSESKNGHGIGYPHRLFWEIASQYHIQAIIGLDAHLVSHIDRTDLYGQAYQFLKELGISTISRLEEKF